MSEAEKKRRLDYKKNRKKWILIQMIAVAVVSLIVLTSCAVYYRVDQAYYIEYTEQGNADYKVLLKDNDFYEGEWVDGKKAYVASLIDNIKADFSYALNMDANDVKYEYNYSVIAKVLVVDKSSGTAIYEPEYELVPKTANMKKSGAKLNIKETVDIDYQQYNNVVADFIKLYNLKGVDSSVLVTMTVNVVSQCASFESASNNNTYSVSLRIPLVTDSNTVTINMTSSVPESNSKVLACESAVNKDVFKVIAIVAGILDVLIVAFLLTFIYITRNEDIRYEARVNKILSNYRSFIQVITNVFNSEGYQILKVSTFTEMLNIRDTLQSPILMNENEDKTCTTFIIPTHTKILYTFEIKVANYDEIYGTRTEEDDLIVAELEEELESAEEFIEETVILAENVDEEALEAALASPDVVLENIDYEEDDDDEYEVEEYEPGVEVIGVVWPEKTKQNKVYRYDPNGEKLTSGDVVLVPSRDVAKNRDIIRKAAVAHGNHRVDPEHIEHSLKKIIGIVKRKAEYALTPDSKE